MAEETGVSTERRVERLAFDVLRLSINILLLNLRYMDKALSYLTPTPLELNKAPLATDSEHLYFDSAKLLHSYKSEKERPVRDCLHCVLHCVFAHPFASNKLNQDAWNAACDIAVENVISQMSLRQLSCQREFRQQKILDDLKRKVNHMTAESIYRYFLDHGFGSDRLEEYRFAFYADSHTFWPCNTTDSSGPSLIGCGSNVEFDASNDNNETSQIPHLAFRMSEYRFGKNEALQRKWEDIARHMKTDLQTFSSDAGTSSAAMMQALGLVTKEKYDYEQFLRQFSVSGEAIKVNDDDFDCIFYTYGLRHYDRMPLVEPLEYKDVNRIKEFVVAIDTSGSVSGDLVQRFVEKTYNILQSEESFFKKMNLHIFQCDAEIQQDARITSRKEFDDYLQRMQLSGFGGTDFRPVFDHVENLRRLGEIKNLKGLIYFTDGYGTFPERKPDYKTAFCFVQQEGEGVLVPPWAYKLILEDEEI